MMVSIGKNEHDDSPDSLVQVIELVDGGMAKVESTRNPFA